MAPSQANYEYKIQPKELHCMCHLIINNSQNIPKAATLENA